MFTMYTELNRVTKAKLTADSYIVTKVVKQYSIRNSLPAQDAWLETKQLKSLARCRCGGGGAAAGRGL